MPAITTQGNQVLIGGEQGSLAGNSFFWSNFGPVDGSSVTNNYYNENVVSWLQEDWNSTVIRAAMGVEAHNGFLTNPDANLSAVRAVVDAAIAHDMYVLIDWHTHNAESNEQAAINFFSQMAQEYGDHENVIFEIYNEPIGDFDNPVETWNSIRSYAIPVIAAIREHTDNLIIVGTPFFSQRVDVASENPIQGVDNLAYTLHFYAGTHGDGLRGYARTALQNGIPLFVTEWGTVNADGNGGVNEASTLEWMEFLQDNNISHLNWSVNDKNEGASILIGDELHENNQGNWDQSLLTVSGALVREIIRDWPAVGDGDGTPISPVETEPETAFSIPGLIQAEDYSSQSGVQTEDTLDVGGGENIGFIENNDYVEYDVDVRFSGVYTLGLRLASNTTGGDITVQVNGQDLAQASVGFTGGWQDWVTVSTPVELQAGEQTIRLLFTHANSSDGLFNVNYLDFSSDQNPIGALIPILELILNDD